MQYKKKLQVIVVNFLLPDVVLGTECLFLGPQGLVFQRNSGQMCRQKKKSYWVFLWPYLNNFGGNIPGPTLSGWKKLRCPFITFKSMYSMYALCVWRFMKDKWYFIPIWFKRTSRELFFLWISNVSGTVWTST